MKQAFYVGVFTYDAECISSIREYCSSKNAEKYFVKHCENNGHKVIFSAVTTIEEYASLKEFSHNLLDHGFLALKANYPDRYRELFCKQSEDK